MQRNQEIEALILVLLRDRDAMPESSENLRPAKRGNAVSIERSGRGGRDYSDLHFFVAQTSVCRLLPLPLGEGWGGGRS